MPLLTAVNPYVAGTMKAHAGASLMPRQAGGAGTEAGSGAGRCVGISGFAFQGTNAHVTIGRCATPCWLGSKR